MRCGAATGSCFLAGRAAVCLPRPLPPIQPGAYLIQHVIGSCVRLPKRQNPRTAEAAFESPRSRADLLRSRAESEGCFGRAPGATPRGLTTGEFVVTGRDEPRCFESRPLTPRHALSFSRGNSHSIRLPVFESDLPTEINAREGLENETLYQLDSCPLQRILVLLFSSSLEFLSPSRHLFYFPHCHAKTECVPP